MNALIFDCDGVLADTERHGHLPAFNQTFREFGLPVQWSEAEYGVKLQIAGGKERMASLLTPAFRAQAGLPSDPGQLDALVAAWHKRKTQIYKERVAAGDLPGRPGVRRLAQAAQAAGWALAVASTSAEASVRGVLEFVVGPELAAGFLVASKMGVLHLLNNYTGDTMSFDTGREMAEAEGIEVRTVVINDDVAVKDSTWTVGRRGVAGNFFVMKAVGAAAERGRSLKELEELGNRVVEVTRTMGVALTGCTPPAKGSPIFTLADDEMEMGVGIHGEPGRRRVKMGTARQILDELLESVSGDLPFKAGDEVALMINGLGGTPISELYLLYGMAHERLEKRGMKIKRNYVGEYCTSLEMAGCSLTMVRLDPELEDLLAAPAEIAIRVF
jgi:dihydroxyacetone kinase-like protein